ncbi:UTP-glucose-1-phosphate uridylyltransferase [Leifsonia xyli subsp. cynodontis DSM 46306]|uniref:UTP--glucose-1-phosphate uridylyltransferase n=1 Tax=Leifsonia xyli subsp. cynodontis DSM 46306 TaxID=1389489 RepID=U3PEP5_LEIXC|nr:UTP--glucose-1-phosphate uridylyltransferase GalU [Leifsonia xyli]AGW42083.1 UTP-glucose-1-phosphate uridylyltransferase [Leifsonia xyli subsp. cynodontis DSM 46306]
MVTSVTKAVIPAAGLGTRFLPATKAMPKEMLPVVDKPAIQYVVEEAVDAGLHDVLMITGRNKNALENHFDRNAELEDTLSKKGDTDRLEKVNYSTSLADMHYVRQGDPKGLGHAVLRAKMHVGREPFAVLLGDDIIDARDDLLKRMLQVQHDHNSTVVALMEVPAESIHLYGAAAVEATDQDDVVRITGLVEKPDREHAPSTYAIIGRYILRPEVFDVLESTEPGRGGEIQLTDALQSMAEAPDWTGGVYGVVFRGRRYDTGDRFDYIKAIIQLATDRDDLGPELRPWLRAFAGDLADTPSEVLDEMPAEPARSAGSTPDANA